MTDKPDDVKSTLDRLEQEFAWPLLHWAVYMQIFGRSELQVDMLNVAASKAFVSIQVALLHEVLMALSRLTDKKATGKFENLTLEFLEAQIGKKDKTLSENLQGKLECTRKKCERIDAHRNKLLAHLERDQEEIKNLKPIRIKDIDEAIVSIYDYLNICHKSCYPGSRLAVDPMPLFLEAGDQLVSLVKDGLRLRELIDEKKVDHRELGLGKWKDVSRNEPESFPAGKIFLR